MSYEMNMNKIGLSNKSRFMIQLRIFLLILLCLYLPIEVVFSEKFIIFEDEYLFKKILEYFPPSLIDNDIYRYSMKIFLFIFGDKEMLMLYSVILYIIYHPFTAYKIIFVTNLLAFINCILRVLYKSARPFWFDKFKSIGCISSFASPAFSYNLVAFFYFFSFIVIINERNKAKNKEINILSSNNSNNNSNPNAISNSNSNNFKKYKMNKCKKFLLFFFYLIFTSVFGFILIINRINYFYQICFAQVFTMTSLFIILDLESHIHNRIFNSLKNIFKIRKNKIRILLNITFLNLLGIILYNLSEHSLSDNRIYQNLSTLV